MSDTPVMICNELKNYTSLEMSAVSSGNVAVLRKIRTDRAYFYRSMTEFSLTIVFIKATNLGPDKQLL